jgi:O-antigen/teichoic acid export membrane protein
VVLSSYLAITFCGGLLTAGVVTGSTLLLPLPAAERQLLILIAVGNIGSGLFFPPLFDLFHRQARGAWVGAGVDVAAVLVVVALHLSGSLTIIAAGAVLAGKWFLTTLFQALVFHWTIRPLKWAPSAAEIKGMLYSAYPLLLSGLLWFLPVNGGIFFLRAFHGLEQTAVYAIAVQVATGYVLFASLGVRVIQPHINGKYGLERSFIRKLMLFTAVSVGGLWFLTVGAGSVVTFALLDPFYRRGFIPMILLATAAGVLSINLILFIYLARLRREKAVMAAKVLAAVFWALAGVCLVPFTGAGTTAVLAILASLLALIVLVANLSPEEKSR